MLAGVLSAIMILVMIAAFVFWLIALIQTIARHDLKNSKVLWILLLIFVAPIGIIAYGFAENRKWLGWVGIALIVLCILYPIIMAIAAVSLAQQ
jgi:hypothetical protein